MTLEQNDGMRRAWRREGTAHDPYEAHHLMAWVCTAAAGSAIVVFIEDVSAKKSIGMNSEVYTDDICSCSPKCFKNSFDGASRCRRTMNLRRT